MRLLHINIYGFKSYGNKVRIQDFDPEFNAITGLNGSGKSNVLDAICFVLGLKSLAQLRVTKIDDLVYKSGQSGVKKASVELIFDNTDKERSPQGYSQFSVISVSRDVQVGGRDRFTINNKLVKNKQVKELFLSVSLNVNNPHFLIMQGRITKVIAMKPLETLSMLEEAAGTMIYETKRRESEMKITIKDRDLKEVEELLNQEIAPQLEKMVEDREKHQKWCKIGRDIQMYEKLLKVVMHLENSQLLKNEISQIESLTEQIARSKESETRLSETKNDLQNRISQTNDIAESKETVATLKKRADAAKEAFREIRIEVENEEEKMKKLKTTKTENAAAVAKLKKTKASMEENHKDEIKSVEDLRKDIENEKTSLSRKETQLDDLRLGNTTTYNADGEKVSLLDALNANKSEANSIKHHIKELKDSIKRETKELSDLPTAQDENDQYSSTMKRFTQQQEEIKEVQSKLDSLNFNESQYLESVELRNKLQDDIKAIERDKEEFLRSLPNNVRGLVDRALLPSELAKNIFSEDSNVDALVFGPGVGLMRVKDGCQEFGTALEQISQMKLLHSVVADDKVAEKLFQASRRTKQRITCIPLNRIHAPSALSNTILQQAKSYGDVYHPMDLIIPKAPIFETALKYIFGNVLVCREAKTARLICEKLNVSVVTLRGDSYNTSGNISGGSTAGLSDIIQYYSRFGAYMDRQKDLLENLKKNSDFLSQCNRLKVIFTDTNQYLNTLKRKLETTQSILDISKSSSSACQRHELTSSIESNKDLMVQKEEQLAALQTVISDMQSTYTNTTKNMEATIKLLQKEIPGIKKAIKKNEEKLSDMESQNSSFLTRVQELDATISEKERGDEEVSSEIKTVSETLEALQSNLSIRKTTMNSLVNDLKSIETRVAQNTDLTENFKKQIGEIDGEIKSLEKKRSEMATRKEEIAPQAKARQEQLSRIERESPFVMDQPTVIYPEYKKKIHTSVAISKTLASLEEEKTVIGRKFSSVILQKFEDVENRHQDILARRAAVQKEKQSIQEFITELDQQKKEEIFECYRIVNRYFTDLFETLLPGSSCKLEPAEPKQKNTKSDMYRDGLTIHVSFNGIWKKSLDELSGGQRSLIALSFVLALLKYKPAPMYILDEVDAALDLSHTQNIGKLIKNHFSGSQFIVISLKPNLFKNANTIFQTKLVAGVSQISRSSAGTEMVGTRIDPKRSKKE